MMKFGVDARVTPVPFIGMERPKWEESQGLVLELLIYWGRAWSSVGRSDLRHTFGCSQRIGDVQSQHMGEIITAWLGEGGPQGRTRETLTFRDQRIQTLQRRLRRSSPQSRRKTRRE